MGKLSDLRRTELKDRDSRIFPGHYAPVMVMENGRRAVKPMRYQCRHIGKPAFYDTKYPGTYASRRDNLEGFWKGLFGYTHGIAVVNAFYENVNRHRVERREFGVDEVVENAVLEFKPRPVQAMLVACLWSRWTAPGEPDLLSSAAITDEPPPEVPAAGHDGPVNVHVAQDTEGFLLQGAHDSLHRPVKRSGDCGVNSIHSGPPKLVSPLYRFVPGSSASSSPLLFVTVGLG
jgi:hypothetical protein